MWPQLVGKQNPGQTAVPIDILFLLVIHCHGNRILELHPEVLNGLCHL